MSVPDSAELKKKLRGAGFEIYRTTEVAIILAERVRDNLIMDSGVAARIPPEPGAFSVMVTVKAQASHFPGAGAEKLWDHVRGLASAFVASGYEENDAVAQEVADPSHPGESLDTSHEIRLSRAVPSFEDLLSELRAALSRPRSTGEE